MATFARSEKGIIQEELQEYESELVQLRTESYVERIAPQEVERKLLDLQRELDTLKREIHQQRDWQTIHDIHERVHMLGDRIHDVANEEGLF